MLTFLLIDWLHYISFDFCHDRPTVLYWFSCAFMFGGHHDDHTQRFIA